MSDSDYKMNMLQMIMEMMDKHFDNMNKGFDMINKQFDESDKILDEWLRELKTDRLKENSEVELKQVSDNDNSNNELINNSCLLYTSRCV